MNKDKRLFTQEELDAKAAERKFKIGDLVNIVNDEVPGRTNPVKGTTYGVQAKIEAIHDGMANGKPYVCRSQGSDGRVFDMPENYLELAE